MKLALLALWLSTFFLLSASALRADERKYRDSQTPNFSSKTKIHIPADVTEAIVELRKNLPLETTTEVRALKNEKDSLRYHFSIGLWMRNHWELWSQSRLSVYFNGIGIHHPDDMSSIILECFWRDLKGKKCDVEKQAKKYKKFWENAQHRQDNEDKACAIEPELIALERANPLQKAQENFQKGDFRLLGVLGFSLMVPGIPQSDSCLKDFRHVTIIKDTTDAPRCTRHALLQRIARDYAEKYNRFMLKNMTDTQKKCETLRK